MKTCTCHTSPDAHATDAGRRQFLTGTMAAAAAISVAGAGFSVTPANAAVGKGQKKFMEEATNLAIESVNKGWGGPFGAVIVKDGEIIGRGQNRVLLTGLVASFVNVRPSVLDARHCVNGVPAAV